MIIINTQMQKRLIEQKIKEIKNNNLRLPTQCELILLALYENKFVSSIHFVNLGILRYGSRIHEIKTEWGFNINCDVYRDSRNKKLGIYWLSSINKRPKLNKKFKLVNRGSL